ncbi:MAG: glutathione S-transferase family protein [Desulfuromonas sp.]|nr:MAG: glutathione S-transferase family protein [Desulfuromonas sp.]
MIKLYGMPKTRSMRVVWALEEIGAEYRFIPVDLVTGEGRTPGFLALNPGGKVPVLVDGDLVLTESAAICTYLGDRFPESGLVPRCGTVERGLYDQWCYFVMTELEQPLWTIGKHKFALPKEKRVPEIKDTAIWEFQRAAALLASGLGEKPYLLGDNFTMADLLAAHTLAWARSARISHNIDLLDDYRQRMMAREAFQRTLAVEKG